MLQAFFAVGTAVWPAVWAAALAPSAPDAAPARPAATTVIPFRTDAQPRVDPVFGDAKSLRATVDQFLALGTEMARVRDDFSNAVHETLTALAGPPGAAGAGGPVPGKGCPAATATPYARALTAGGKYLLLGQQLQGRYREILRADELGDAAALTPDYRVKVKKARELHQHLLDDYREMRVAFYDQLGAEMRHATCRTGAAAVPKTVVAVDSRPDPKASAGAAPVPNPSDASAWSMDDPAALDDRPAATPSTKVSAKAATPRLATELDAAKGGQAAPFGAPSIWIDVDNTLCAQPTRVSVDGQALGEVGARKKTSVRTHAGPREICALPASDARACGDPGTIRKAYLHEGWSLTVHCDR